MLMFSGILSILMVLVLATTAHEPNGNGVIVAGNMWGSYRPPHIPGAWPRNAYIDDFTTRGDRMNNGNWIFWQSRYVTSGLFGNTVIGWPFGRNLADVWGSPLGATVFDPSAEFAAANRKIFAADPLEPKDLQYSYLKYGTKIPGAGDPARDFVRPGGKTGGGAFYSDDRKALSLYEAGWPTNVGIDVQMRVYSFTTPWGSLDDNQIVEVQFHNTGEADIDGDGVVDMSNHKIESLAMQYSGEPWFMGMNATGTRHYNTGGYRPGFYDNTPDENGHPWAYGGYGFGARNTEREDDPGIGNQGISSGWYHDIVYGFTFLGAKMVDENGNVTGEKMLHFKNAAGAELVHAVGEDERRGWFMSSHSTEPQQGAVGGAARGFHMNCVAQFFLDHGKSRSRAGVDLNPNPSIFQSGSVEDLTTFVLKDDPASWTRPDGNLEIVAPVTTHGSITLPGPNPIPTFGGAQNRPFHPDYIHEGVITENAFTDEKQAGFGPFSLEVGETIRIYFVRGMGFRPPQVRATIKAARAVYDAIQPDGSILEPGAPGVPEIKVTGSTNVKPLIMFATVPDADGYKVYRSRAWPQYDATQDGLMYEGVYWKTMTPGETNRPAPDPINPMLDVDSPLLRLQNGQHWGPYSLLKVISNADLENFQNPRTEDAGSYPYAYEDSEDVFTLPGQTFFYYVAAYKNTLPPAPYAALEDGSVSWIESGKVNVNGRDGFWKNSWPFTDRDAFYPDATDSEALRAIGAAFVLVSPPTTPADLLLGRANVVVRPNPYKRVAFHDVGGEHKILFANLPARATITILDLSGQIVDRIDYTSPTAEDGTFFWDMFSKDGIEVANGAYIWVVEYDGGLEKGILSILR
jgi:hypothetical protein